MLSFRVHADVAERLRLLSHELSVQWGRRVTLTETLNEVLDVYAAKPLDVYTAKPSTKVRKPR
jgi:hypothetical protein